MQKLIKWCKSHWLLAASCFLLLFIPLYPKLPLFDIVQTWVYIRLEDLVVAIVYLLFFLMLWKQKLFPHTPLTTPILIYWLIGALSLLVAMFIIIPSGTEFRPHLGLLHFLRRIEYMLLFFIGFYALQKHTKALPAFIWTLVITCIVIILYGLGQKLYGFPAFLTMNEEFAKGIPLRLPPTARIPSTFGGHYDLAAYLVFVIPIFGSLAIGAKVLWQKLAFIAVAIGSLVLLLLTASRISFGVYLIAIVCMLIWQKRYVFIVPVLIVSFFLLNSVSTASERFYKTLRFSDVVIDLSTGQPIGTLESLEGGTAKIEQQESPATENLPKGSEFIGVPQAPSASVKTIEVYTSSALATGSGEIATVSGSFLVQKAFVYDISITTRFQGQWPKALAAFSQNVLLGSGFSSLNVASDGDYLRMLGETGILGSFAFLGILLMFYALYFKGRFQLSVFEFSFVTGVAAGLVGLLVNALLIDVFEASKVAFSLWLIMGMAVALLVRSKKTSIHYSTVLWQAISSRVSSVLLLFVVVFLFYGKSLSMYFLGDDFTWLRWASSSTIGDIGEYFTDASGFFYRPITKFVNFFLYTFFWLKPWGYHLFSLSIFGGIAVLLFYILEKRGVQRFIAFVSALLFITLSIHHENVFWISGLSSLLSVFFGLIGVLLTVSNTTNKSTKFFTLVALYASSFLSALSYEGGIVTPLLLVYVAWFIAKKRSFIYVLQVLLIPLYWWMRSQADAVPLSGDYNYNLSKLVINTFANGIGYLVSSVGGPMIVELFSNLRQYTRSIYMVGWLALIVPILGFVIFTRTKSFYKNYTMVFHWIVVSVIAMLPFLGLGGLADRYAFYASAFVVLALCELFVLWWNVQGIRRVVVLIIILMLAGWNGKELHRLSGDWKKASDVTKSTVLALKKNFFPLADKQAFVFVNTPIRYGRAWIFPTGVDDAMWHMYKLSSFPYQIFKAATVEDAFTITSPLGEPIVLVFDDFVLSRAYRTIQTVEEEAAP